jgi:hypothetical protein
MERRTKFHVELLKLFNKLRQRMMGDLRAGPEFQDARLAKQL